MINCPRCDQPVDETERTTCPLCFTPLRPEANAPENQPGAAPAPGAPAGYGAVQQPQGQMPPQMSAPPLYQTAPPPGAPVQPGGMPLNAPSSPPQRGPNTRMTLNGDIIEAPPTPAAPPPIGGNYAGRPAAPRPGYGASSARVEPRRRSGGGATVAIAVVLLLLGGGGFGGYYWWTHRANPKDTAQKYLTAFKAQDWKSVYDMTEQTAQSKQMFANSQDFADKAGKLMSLFGGMFASLTFEAQDAKDNDGTTATVPIKITGSVMGQSVNQSVDLKLKNVDGVWKVAAGQNMGGMGGGMGGGGMGGGRMGGGMRGLGGR